MSKTKFIVLPVVLLMLIGVLAVGIFYFTQEEETPIGETVKSIVGAKCGDGICGSVERKAKTCPADCSRETEESVLEGTEALNLGLMVHLEGWDHEVVDENAFRLHVEAVRTLAHKLEEYGAVGTFEAHTEFVQAAEKWNDPIMQELVDAGHAIAVHADVGGNPKEGLTLADMTKQLKIKKKIMEEITGVEVRHVSGICSHLDWAKAAIDAGYDFVTGIVAYCVMAMDYEDRPDEYKNCSTPSECHDVYPPDIEDRIEPWRVSSASDWTTHDPKGDLVIIMEAGGIYGMNEEYGDGTGGMELTSEDVEVFIEQLDRAIAAMDDKSVNTIYLSWSIGDPRKPESPVVDEWLQAVQEYVDAGLVEWKTIPEMYDDYVAWEKQN